MILVVSRGLSSQDSAEACAAWQVRLKPDTTYYPVRTFVASCLRGYRVIVLSFRRARRVVVV
jgi:predicted transcriptional regulator